MKEAGAVYQQPALWILGKVEGVGIDKPMYVKTDDAQKTVRIVICRETKVRGKYRYDPIYTRKK